MARKSDSRRQGLVPKTGDEDRGRFSVFEGRKAKDRGRFSVFEGRKAKDRGRFSVFRFLDSTCLRRALEACGFKISGFHMPADSFVGMWFQDFWMPHACGELCGHVDSRFLLLTCFCVTGRTQYSFTMGFSQPHSAPKRKISRSTQKGPEIFLSHPHRPAVILLNRYAPAYFTCVSFFFSTTLNSMG